MLKIALCDDELKICGLYRDKIQRWMEENGIESAISIYSKPQEFLTDLQKTAYSLVFLDIDMPGISGLQIAGEMKSMAQRPLLIFVTNQDALVYQTFQYHPFGFIRKSFLGEELSVVLGQAVEELRNRQRRYTFKCEKETITVQLSDIMYLEAEGNYIMLHAKETVYRIRETMTNVEKELETKGFVRIHKGFLVNEEAVYRIGSDDVTLADGVVLPIGRSNKEQAKEKLMRYLMA